MLRRPADQRADLHLLTSRIGAASSQSTGMTLFELIEAIGDRRVPVVFDPGLAKKPIGVGASLRHMLSRQRIVFRESQCPPRRPIAISFRRQRTAARLDWASGRDIVVP